jgi:hypothetical protein
MSWVDVHRCNQWVAKLMNDDLVGKPPDVCYKYRVCGKHFEERCFLNPRKKDRLSWDAVPTLHISPPGIYLNED